MEQNKTILDARVVSYIRKAIQALFWIYVGFTITEIMYCLLLLLGCFKDFLLYENNISITKEQAIFSTIFLLGETWLSFIIYIVICRKASFKINKIGFAAFLILITTIQAFGHGKISYLSIIYCIPVCMTSPLGKKVQFTTLIISLVLSVIYYLFQIIVCYSKLNLLNFSVTLFIIVTLYYVTRIIYKAMVNDIDELTKYSQLSQNLNEQLSKDLHTGALSKKTFLKDLDNDKLLSIAILDIDDFKMINNTYGMGVGDNVLENLVDCANEKGLKIYRYDGDEFAILTSKTVSDLCEKIEDLKFSFALSSSTYWSIKPTFSAGILPLSYKKERRDDVYKCEELMMEGKNGGKNKIISHLE